MPYIKSKPLPEVTRRDADRFWRFVRIGVEGECWEWRGHTHRVSGHGIFYAQRRFNLSGPRMSFRLYWGGDPYPCHVLHSCDNRKCCNPHHLSLGWDSENQRQRYDRKHWNKKARKVARRDTRCKPLPEITRKQADRFWSYVEIRSDDECWLWLGTPSIYGYGQFGLTYEHRALRPHRVAFRLYYGADPFPSDILHQCDNRLCCNPNHHKLGNRAVNAADREARGRTTRGEGFTKKRKLSEADVRSIKGMVRDGISQRKAAIKFAVSPANIRAIVIGKIWRHIE